MGTKKRKSLEAGSELPKKKTKISTNSEADQTTTVSQPKKAVTATNPTTTLPAPSGAGSKHSRKRAADFLSDDEDDNEAGPIAASSKKPKANGDGQAVDDAKKRKRQAKKAKKAARKAAKAAAAVSLTADGVNGVIEQKGSAEAKTHTPTKAPALSMQEEAQRTVDQEIEEEFGGFGESQNETRANVDRDDEDDAGDVSDTELLAGFDSDSPDSEGNDFDGKVPVIPEKSKNALQKIEKKSVEQPGTIYVGRIPHGFYEDSMRAYFSQFGDVTRIRLSRNKRTAASKHFGFVEFASEDVAKIVAATMDNYLMYNHILKTKFAPAETLHPDVWKGANKRFRKIPHDKIEREKLEQPKSMEYWQKKNKREKKKRDKKAKQLNETMGYEMLEVPLKDPEDAVEQRKLLGQHNSAETVKEIEQGNGEGSKEPRGDIEVPKETTVEANGGGKGEEEPSTKSKKSKKDKKKKKNAKADVTPLGETVAPAEKGTEGTAKSEAASTESRAAVPAPNTKAAATSEPATKAASRKYVPPTHRKQQAKADFARKHPELHREKKRQEAADKRAQRAIKIAKRQEKLRAKFGDKNVSDTGKKEKGKAAA